LLQDDYTGREKFFGAAGTLRELNLADLRTPISEARSYLLAKYADRYNIHPRLLEQIVGDIFKSLGYMTVVTAYANDGGIDVFLERDGVLVGVQVKRHRASIDVEQIRSLAGAMVLRGLTEGIFVTTSRFRSGAHKAVDAYEQAGYKIQLINATHLYDALKLTRGTGCRSKEEFHERYKMLSLRPLDSDYRDSATIAEG
jgi:restriction system protein